MRKMFSSLALLVSMFLIVVPNIIGDVIDFEDLDPGYETYQPLPSGYAGFNWHPSASWMTKYFYPGSGYEYGTIGRVSLFTKWAHSISMADGSFNFDGAYITAAWDSAEQVIIEGWKDSSLKYTQTITTYNDKAYWFDFDFIDVDTVWFIPDGNQIAIDNITYNTTEEVDVDIKPGSCPNPMNVKKKEDSKSVLPVGVLGGPDLDVSDVDLTSLKLGVTGPNGTFTVPVIPDKSVIEDVAAPAPEGAECFDIEYHDLDGFVDVTVYFYVRAVVDAMVAAGIPLDDGADVTLVLTGQLNSGVYIKGMDIVVLRVKGNLAPSKHNTVSTVWGMIKSE